MGDIFHVVLMYISANAIELTGFIFGVIYVFLVIREHYLCWIAGSINVLMYIVVFYQSSLYGMSLLQVFYLGMSIYGFLLWRGLLKPHGSPSKSPPITRMPLRTWGFMILLFILSTVLVSFLLGYTNSEMPKLDGLITMMGLAATWMTARKFIENWLVWIVNDLICVVLYLHMELYLTAILYAIFLVMAVVGYITWTRRMKTEMP